MKYEAHISDLNDRLQKISDASRRLNKPSYQTGNVAKKNSLASILFVITLVAVSSIPIVTQKQKLVVLTDGVYVLEKSLFFNDEFNITRKQDPIIPKKNISKLPDQDIESMLTLKLALTHASK
jgi:hypothetical protein